MEPLRPLKDVWLKPRRVFHWATFYAPRSADIALMNGIGFAHTVLDRYLGAKMTFLPPLGNLEIQSLKFHTPTILEQQ